MNEREAHASALDYVIRVAAAQDNVEALAHYLGLADPWQGEGMHPDVDLLGGAVGEVLDDLRRRLRRLKTEPARGSATPNGAKA